MARDEEWDYSLPAPGSGSTAALKPEDDPKNYFCPQPGAHQESDGMDSSFDSVERFITVAVVEQCDFRFLV